MPALGSEGLKQTAPARATISLPRPFKFHGPGSRVVNVTIGRYGGVKHLADATAKPRFTAGPRLLIAATSAAIALGVFFIYFREGSHPSYFFFFFLPIAAVSVVLGRMVGLLMALATIAVTLLPAVWLSFDRLMIASDATAERTAILTVWAVFLIAMAYLVGWVSERGGSLSFAQGVGSQAIRAMELERKRTGQDIHDGIAQYAAAASLETQVLHDMTADADALVQTQVERVKGSLDMLVFEARTMIGNLRPPALGPEDFNGSMSSLVESLQNRTGIFSDLELEGDFAIHTDSARICVYRIAQEALANAEQHSAATRVHVWASASKSGVDLIVRDNGKGFDPKGLSPENGNHFGLSGMRERAEYLGGRLFVKSNPGEGTSVVLHIPRYRGGGSGR
jgi:two-component system sensor histidine kinase DegS